MFDTNAQRWVKMDEPNRWDVDVFFKVYSYYTNSEISKKNMYSLGFLSKQVYWEFFWLHCT